MGEEQVQVDVAPCGDGVLVTVVGVVDALSLPVVSRELTDAQRGSGTVYVHLAGVTFMDSRGLGSLLAANERSREGAAPIRIFAPSDAVRRLLDVSGVTQVLIEVTELPV